MAIPRSGEARLTPLLTTAWDGQLSPARSGWVRAPLTTSSATSSSNRLWERAFLMLQARSRAIDMWRSESSRHARELADPRARAAPTATIDDDALRNVRTQAGLQMLDHLPRPERDAIALAYFGGHTYREVADLLGVPHGTIKTRIRTGLGRLRQVLSDGRSTASGDLSPAGP